MNDRYFRAVPLVIIIVLLLLSSVFFGGLIGLGVFPISELYGVALLALVVSVFASYCILVFYAAKKHRTALAIVFGLAVFFIDFSIRSQGEYAPQVDFQVLLKAMVWGGAIVIGLVNYRQLSLLWSNKLGVLLIVFSMWLVITTTYSISPVYTLAASLAFFGFVVFSCILVQEFSLHTLLKITLISLVVLLVISLLLNVVLPGLVNTHFGISPNSRFKGLTGSPNNLGRSASLAILIAIILFVGWKDKFFYLSVVIVIAGFALFLSESRTTALALLASAILGYFHRWSLVSVLLLALVTSVLLFFLLQGYGGLDWLFAKLSRSGDAAEIYTVTNRADIWQFVINKFEESPLLGYGYASTNTLLPELYSTKWGYTVGSAHNLLLQSLLTTGLVGTSLLIGILFLQFKHVLVVKHYYVGAVFFFVFITGLTEAGMIGVVPNLLTLLWIISVIVSIPKSGNFVTK